MRRILFTETNLNELPAPPIGYRYIGFNGSTFSVQSESGIIPTGIQGPQGPIGPTGSGGGGSIINVLTYTELTSLISSDSLETGSYYLISDFRTCYDQPDFDVYGNGITSSNTYKMAEIQPIIVLATSDNTLDSNAYQPIYPNDRIRYDVTWNQTEVTGGTAYGRITERIDEFNNRTDYDHRNVRFKRYRTRLLDGVLDGRIISMNEGVVIGTASNFTGDFASGSVVFIESLNPTFYKVTNIISATQMTVTGSLYDNFSDSIGFRYHDTRLRQSVTPGCLYYFNDVADGSNDIDDGGDDMYDTGNILNTNLFSQIPYTHTQMNNVSGHATLEDFTYDGSVENGDSYFGTTSSYFTNTYPGLFVMAAYDVSVTDFSITGSLGADGDGDVEVNRYTYAGYTIFVKKVFNAGDPSVNHIIIVDSTDELIERTYSVNTNDDDHEITNLGNVTQIHYLLFGLAGGVKPTDTQIENVYQSYLQIIDNVDINVTLSSLSANFTDVTDNLPPNSTTFTSLEAKQTNIVEDNQVYREVLTFDTDVTARNNYIGNASDSYLWAERDFMLANNVFTNAFNSTVDIYDNHFGDACINNTFGDDVYENFVGSEFENNMCQDRFSRNTIASNFINNRFYTTEFETNTVEDYFANNIFISNNEDFYDNHIGPDFVDNRFYSGSQFHENTIGQGFNFNRIHNELLRNQIGVGFNNNDLYAQFYDNTIRNGFNNNDIYNDFYDNFIDNQFENNTVGISTEIDTNTFYKNKFGVDTKGNLFQGEVNANRIGDNFSGNTIGNYFNRNVFGYECINNNIRDDFQDNHIGNYFVFNTIGNLFIHNRIGNNFDDNIIENNFAYNEIGHYFNRNNIGNDFGFGGGQAYGNKIGNYFENNEIGEYFYSNMVNDLFSSNSVGHHFRFNDVKIRYLYNQNLQQGYNEIISFTDNTGASPSIPGSDGVYVGLTCVSVDHGVDATFDVTVASSVVTNVSLNFHGYGYDVGDELIIPYQSFGGTEGFDIIIIIASVSATPPIYGNYNSTVFENSNNQYRVSHYDNNDVLTITDLVPAP